MLKLLLTLLLTGCFLSAHAQDLSRPTKRPSAPVAQKSDDRLFTKYILSLGSHTEFFNNIQNDTSGGLRKFDLAPTLGLGFYVPLSGELSFLPEVNWVLPQMNDDSKIMKNIFMLRADWGYTPVEWFRVRVGTSLIWLNQHGRGGSVKMNNGNTSSTFYYPDENRSSLNNTLDVGGEFIWDEWALRLQTYTYSVFRNDRRQISYTIFLSYYWDR